MSYLIDGMKVLGYSNNEIGAVALSDNNELTSASSVEPWVRWRIILFL